MLIDLTPLTVKIEASPFKNVYWFSRYLLDTDQYGGIGRNKEMRLLKQVSFIENITSDTTLTDDEKFVVAKKSLLTDIYTMASGGTKVGQKYAAFAQLLDNELCNIIDVIVFCITVKYIVSPINKAMAMIPSDDYEFSTKTARAILDTYGQNKVGAVIKAWDNLGLKGCLNAERAVIVDAFSQLTYNVSKLNVDHKSLDDNIIFTAFVQEFERRVGQKRKTRGGHSLESVVNFLFEYFKIKSSRRPSHFDQDIEVDQWFRCNDGWSIGISCKRTLRERWKQLSQADRGTLSHFKIREIWHLITFDSDLTDDKIVRLGEQSQVFYLLDDSPVYERCMKHSGMSSYVRPLSHLITDIHQAMQNR